MLDDDKVGIRVSFPGRSVAGMVVTELSDNFLRSCFSEDSGLSVRNGIIELPKVPLNRSAHYKVMAALERATEDGRREQFAAPVIEGGIKGGVGNGRIQETKSHTGTSRPVIALIGFLVLVIIAQLTVALSDDTAPLDCATGALILTGSTAFEAVLQDAADMYEDTCPGASFKVETEGSGPGLERLDQAGAQNGSRSPDMLAFSDGAKPDRHPQLLPRPIAFSLFTLVINEDTGVQDLSREQIKQLYTGSDINLTRWTAVEGNDQPARLISRPLMIGP